METISWKDFEKVELRVGRVIRAEPFPEARKPAYILHVDFGEAIGTKKASAQITHLYEREALVGAELVAVPGCYPTASVLGLAPLVKERLVAREGKLPVPNFAAGGIATPADVSLMMQLGAEAVFVGSGIFKSEHPEKMARAIVLAATHHRDASMLAEISRGLGSAMPGIEINKLDESELLQTRGW